MRDASGLTGGSAAKRRGITGPIDPVAPWRRRSTSATPPAAMVRRWRAGCDARLIPAPGGCPPTVNDQTPHYGTGGWGKRRRTLAAALPPDTHPTAPVIIEAVVHTRRWDVDPEPHRQGGDIDGLRDAGRWDDTP